MRSQLIVGLATVTLAFGVTCASAAPVDAFKNTAGMDSMVAAQGSSMSGLSALKSSPTNNVKPADVSEFHASSPGLTMPQAWTTGPEGSAAIMPSNLMAPAEMQQAMMPSQGMPTNLDGFAAIKQAPALKGESAPAVGSLRSAANNDLYFRSSK